MGTFAKTEALILLVNKDFNSATSKKKKKNVTINPHELPAHSKHAKAAHL